MNIVFIILVIVIGFIFGFIRGCKFTLKKAVNGQVKKRVNGKVKNVEKIGKSTLPVDTKTKDGLTREDVFETTK